MALGSHQDDNVTVRTWHPDGPNGQVKQDTKIWAHHEVLLKLDAVDLERGTVTTKRNPLTPSNLHLDRC